MKTKLSNIFSKLHILDNMYLNFPAGKERELDFLCDAFNKDKFNSLEQLVEELIDFVGDLTEAGIFQYTKKELSQILEVRESTKGDLINLFLTQANESYFRAWKDADDDDDDDDELFDENFPEILESTVSYIIKECTDKLIPKINKAVTDGKFELHELFNMRIDDTNYHALNPSDFVVAAMEKVGFDSDENEKLFDYLYDLVEDRVGQILGVGTDGATFDFVDADDDLTFDEKFPEVSESDVNAIISACTKKIIPIINEAVVNGEFELHELFKMNPAIDDTNYHYLNPSDFVLAEMQKFDFDPNFEDSELFDYLYDLVEDSVSKILGVD